MSWINVGVMAASTAYSIYSSNKKSKENKAAAASGPSIEMLDTRNDDQKAIDGAMSSWITQYLPNFKPGESYTGNLSAPMSGFEGQGMNFLQQFLTSKSGENPNPLLGLAGDELTKTFTGQYDPSTSPFYKATRDAAAVEQQTGQNKLNAQLGSRGKYFSSEALNQNQQLQTNTTNFLNQTLTGMAEKERQRRLDAVPMAESLDKSQTAASLAPVAAATTFGALPRQLEQEDYERQYQAWLNQRTEMAMPVSAARGSFQGGDFKTVGINQPQTQSFDWGSFLGNTISKVDWGSMLTKVLGSN